MPKNAMRGLILRGGALGDGLLTLPVLHALRHAFPGIVIEWTGNPRVAGLLLTAGLVQRIRSLDEAVMAELYVPRGSRNIAEAEWIRSFDFVLHFLHDPDGVVAENLNRMGATRVICCSPAMPRGHASRHFLRALTELGITDHAFGVAGPRVGGVGLPWPVERRKAGRAWLSRLGLNGDVVALHPGSGSPRKNWPLEKFMGLGRCLRKRSVNVLFLLGEAETSFLPAVLLARPQHPCEGWSAIARRATVEALAQAGPVLQESGLALLREAPIETVADALSACRGYVGNDSGVTHLAAVLGLPVVAIFGPTDPALWGPLSPKSVTIRSAGRTSRSLAAIPVETVMKAICITARL